jgi:hypothetical protein
MKLSWSLGKDRGLRTGLCSEISSAGDRRIPVSDIVVDCSWELCAVRSAPSDDEGTGYTDMVVIMGELGSVWHSIADGVAMLR